MKYKCYLSNTNNERYYWYFKDKNTSIYGNCNGMILNVKDPRDLDRVANVTLYSISPTTAHIIFNHTEHIYCARDAFYDVEA